MDTPEPPVFSPETVKLLIEMLAPEIRDAIRAELHRHFIVVLNEHSRHVWIHVDDIAWVTVDHEIVVYHTPSLQEKSYHTCGSLKSAEEKINNPAFFQANKNTLVNRNKVASANTGHREIIMDAGMTIHYTETYYAVVRHAIPDFFKKMTA